MPEPSARAGRRDPGRRPPAGVPGWVKAFAVALGVLLLAFVVLHLTGLSPMTGH